MECIVANVDHIKFDIETALDEQYGALSLPFSGMDKSISAVCQFYTTANGCTKGVLCPFRHVRGDRTIVCKHWLRGLCKKGDQCEFLHEYDMTKMPECYFYSRFNACHNKECPFLHIDPESKIKDCPWYDRGFCRHGPHCRHRHVRRVLCTNYLAGYCPDGAACKYMHPRFELPAPPDQQNNAKELGKKPLVIICHFCGEHGHKAIHCGRNSEVKEVTITQSAGGDEPFVNNHHHGHHHHHYQQHHHHSNRLGGNDSQQLLAAGGGGGGGDGPLTNQLFNRNMPKKLEDVTCYKCGNKGHYANRCPKGHLAFLSQAKALQENRDRDRERERDKEQNQ